ncbi:hypothetical protein [Streptomyces sp. NPDC005805]|uniref:hypothetical protein n=1 Tax=Streptomyces sp. NPDC005805 TaxID=3157068 RepID=UPI0033C229B9
MVITGEHSAGGTAGGTAGNAAPGTALLLTAAPAGRARLIDAASVLPALAAVPGAVMAGAGTAGTDRSGQGPAATVVELADPLEPQAVLTRIRAAAAAPGPLVLYLAGQLHMDRKQRLLHFALARTTPATVRYTALPWHWLAGELGPRRPGSTTVVVDLVADADAWPELAEGRAALGPSVRLYGSAVRAAGRRALAEPAYLKAMAAIWRSGARPPLDELHELAATASAPEQPADRLLFAPTPTPTPAPTPFPTPAAAPAPASASEAPPAPSAEPEPKPEPAPDARPAPAGSTPDARPSAPAPDPHAAILAAALAGRHGEAAAAAAVHEGEALRTHGPGTAEALHWLEVRADLARLAGDPAGSCALWAEAAEARLGRGEPPGAPDVTGAVDRAHHQWEQARDSAAARRLAPALLRLRRQVPGPDGAALLLLRRRLAALDPGT